MAKAGLLFVGTEDGLLLWSNPNEIGRWLRIGQPFRGAAVRAVWAAPENPLLVFAAVEGQGVQRSEDGGQSWQALFEWPAYAIGGHAPGAVYVCAASAVAVSRDQGRTWQQHEFGAGQATGGPLVAADARLLYVAAGAQLLRSEDGGQSWAAYGAPLPAPIVGLAAAPQRPGLVYVVAAGALYTCSDVAAPWAALPAAPAARGPVAALPGKSAVLLLAGAAGGIARSADEGATWAPVLAEGALDVLAPATYHVDAVFAGSADGQLLNSTDRGRTWQVVKPGLPPILCIAAARLL